MLIFSLTLNRLVTDSSASTNGLIISYLLPLSSMAGALIYPMIHLAKSGVSIQRLYEYAQWKVHEKPFFSPKAPKNWPRVGKIEVRNLSARYRKGLPLVLDGINFNINSGEKVAIIGRTGSGKLILPINDLINKLLGKSTALLTLMRILEMAEDDNGKPLGSITIDGVRID